MDYPANDNCFVFDGNEEPSQLPDGWHKYDEVKMTSLGPVGIIKGLGFNYLEPALNEGRG